MHDSKKKKEKWDSEANHHPAKFKMAAPAPAQMRVIKLREMDEKNMHNLFLKNMAGLIEEIKNPSPCTNP